MNQIQKSYAIAAFYYFQSILPESVEARGAELEELGKNSGLRGLIILAPEGINGTISGQSQEAVITYLEKVSGILGFPKIECKWSQSEEWPFRRFKVRLRDEIVTLGKPEVLPLAPKSPTHLSPKEWDEAIATGDIVMIDTRNWYETKLGKFKGAIDPKLEEFRQFPDFLQQADFSKDQKFLIYCTGGIRCEKAIVEMNNQGFNNVFQLDGGILNYLAQRPDQSFEGECFVFDHRVAVDQNLESSKKYHLCPHCGQPADHEINCLQCETPSWVCDQCLHIDPDHATCSKNCAYHYKRVQKKFSLDKTGIKQTLFNEVRTPNTKYEANQSPS